MYLDGSSTRVYWSIPSTLSTQLDYTKARIYRSNEENRNYELVEEINSQISGSWVTQYDDDSDGNSRSLWYLVTLYNPTTQIESPFITPFFDFLPRESRWISSIRGSLPKIVNDVLTDDSIRQSIVMSIQMFNQTSPVTDFNIETFPYEYEIFLFYGSQLLSLVNQYLPFSIRDFNYSIPGGISLTVDRGEKINSAIENVMNIYRDLLRVAKMEFAYSGEGLGSFALPLSLGGKISSGVLNVLNVFSMSF